MFVLERRSQPDKQRNQNIAELWGFPSILGAITNRLTYLNAFRDRKA
jgi:hypothetical protein